jgi:hypothetical protein
MHVRTLPALVAITSLAVLGFGTAASASATPAISQTSAASVPVPVPAATASSSSLNRLCQAITPGVYCWTEHTTSPHYVFYNTSQSASDFYYYLDTGECDGGYVTSTCPFADPALDNAVIGHQIVSFGFANTGLCMAARSDAYLDGATCSSGANEAFIAESGSHVFESVGGSNYVYAKYHDADPNDVEEVCPSSLNGGLEWGSPDTCAATFGATWYWYSG